MKKIKVDPYNVTIHLTTSFAEYERRYKKLSGNKFIMDESYCGLCSNLQRNIMVGVFSEGIDTLIHELTHAALFICTNLGIKPFEDHEPLCYMMGKIVTDCIKACPEILYQKV